MNYEEAMNRLALKEIGKWHQEQADELVGDELQEEMRNFHISAAFLIQQVLK